MGKPLLEGAKQRHTPGSIRWSVGRRLRSARKERGTVERSRRMNERHEPPSDSSPAAVALEEESAEELASRLAEKEALIVALTEQLERAAEQLDRLQRSGADRRKQGFLPPELAEEHKQLLGDLSRVVQQWEDLQAGLTLGRIEIQLGELRDLILSRWQAPSACPEADSPPRDHLAWSLNSPSPQDIHGAAPQASSEVGAPVGFSPEISEWDRLKSQLLEATEVPSEKPAPFEEPLPPPPPAVDVSTASAEDLAAAVTARDEFIGYLLRRLRAAEAGVLPADWSPLAQHDPEWTARLQRLAEQLEEKLRLSEVEFSLERARLAREHTRLQHQQELLAKQLKRLGLKSIEDLEEQTPANATNHERRWVRFLGINRPS